MSSNLIEFTTEDDYGYVTFSARNWVGQIYVKESGLIEGAEYLMTPAEAAGLRDALGLWLAEIGYDE